MQRLQNIKRVAVVGGGPAGVALAKYLEAEKAFTTIHVFEQRSTCGGVWNYTAENDREAQFHVPQTKPYDTQEQPLWRRGNETNPRLDPTKKHATFISPLYERLEANLPKMIMQHSDLAFPSEEQLFPTHAAITEYLERYADDVRHLISFETQVVEIQPRDPEAKNGFSVTTENLSSKERQTSNYDAVAIATGHYTVPFIPEIRGLEAWNKQFPGSITHSKFYRKPEDFTGKRVLTIGVGYSGIDIANQIEPFTTPPLLVSSRNPPDIPQPSPSTTRHNVGEISHFDAKTHSIHFKSPPSFVAHDVDVVVFCTGYLYSYPGIDASAAPFSASPLLVDNDGGGDPGARTHNLYEHIFYAPAPSLAFLALPQKVVPFPISESQAAVVAGVWSGRLGLPGFAAMQAWEEERAAERGGGKTFHYMRPGEDVEYMDMLHEWAMGGDGAGKGKEPPKWGEKARWIRERVFEIKEKFVALGEGRHECRTLEELGFDFEGLKNEGEGCEEGSDWVVVEEEVGVYAAKVDEAGGG